MCFGGLHAGKKLPFGIIKLISKFEMMIRSRFPNHHLTQGCLQPTALRNHHADTAIRNDDSFEVRNQLRPARRFATSIRNQQTDCAIIYHDRDVLLNQLMPARMQTTYLRNHQTDCAIFFDDRDELRNQLRPACDRLLFYESMLLLYSGLG